MLSADGKTIKLRINLWSETFLVDDLGDRIDLYRELSIRKDGKYLSEYRPTLDALIAVSERISAPQGHLGGNH